MAVSGRFDFPNGHSALVCVSGECVKQITLAEIGLGKIVTEMRFVQLAGCVLLLLHKYWLRAYHLSAG